MHADNGRVDHLRRRVVATSQRVHNLAPHARPPPANEAIVAGGIWTEAGGQVPRAGYDIVDWFEDGAVSGADPIETRPGFTAALARIAGNGVRTIIVETANRFARDLMVQEVGFAMLAISGSHGLRPTARHRSLTMALLPS
jgi:hypothetical protein